MSTHNIGFYEDLTKLSLNYHQISSITHLISSAAGTKGTPPAVIQLQLGLTAVTSIFQSRSALRKNVMKNDRSKIFKTE